MKRIIYALCMLYMPLSIYAQNWLLTGNSGTTPGTNFIGTTDARDLVFKASAVERGRLLNATGAWRFGSATNYARIDSTGKLSFGGSGAYQVAGNKYAFQYSGNPNYGLFFNSTSALYEFRNGSAVSVFSINANSGNSVFNGTVRVGGYTLPATDGVSGQVLKTDGTGTLTWQADNSGTGSQWTSTGSNIYYNTGYVGIGTNAPSTALHVASSGANPMRIDGSTGMYISLYEDGQYRGYLGSYSGAAADVDFGTVSGNSTGKLHLTTTALPRLSIDPSGNVGIGTTAPTAKTQVSHNSSISNPSLLLYESEADYGRLSFKNSSSSSYWTIAGFNSPTNSSERLNFYNSTSGDVMSLAGDGRVSIGTTSPAAGYKLSVQGKIICEELKVALRASWPDYVFDKKYKLMRLSDLEDYINENKHLPGIASAAEMQKEGISLGEMQARLLEKIEELTLYMIDLKKENAELKKMLTTKEKINHY